MNGEISRRPFFMPHPARRSRILRATGSPAPWGLPQDKVHGIWVSGPGSYGRNDAGDAGIDAALLSTVGRPVRVQGMRYEGHGGTPRVRPRSIGRAPPSTRTVP